MVLTLADAAILVSPWKPLLLFLPFLPWAWLITAVYDNSEQNPNNPDPDSWVSWGDQTFEEMMIGFLDYLDAE